MTPILRAPARDGTRFNSPRLTGNPGPGLTLIVGGVAKLFPVRMPRRVAGRAWAWNDTGAVSLSV